VIDYSDNLSEKRIDHNEKDCNEHCVYAEEDERVQDFVEYDMPDDSMYNVNLYNIYNIRIAVLLSKMILMISN